MLNDAKYKTCLTLILTSSNSNANPLNLENSTDISIDDNDDDEDKTLNQIIPVVNDINSSVEMNRLSHKMNRTFVRSESFNEPLNSNETIIPIKCLSRDESIDSQQILSTETTTESNIKYCCTLEVKFVWYETKTNAAKNI